LGKKRRSGRIAIPTLENSDAPHEGVRLDVRRTPKLYIGGAFPRSESGRTDALALQAGSSVNVARASRKDVREAVRIARAASESWAAKSAMVRGQILYRVAELMEGRAGQFESDLREHGRGRKHAAAEVAAAIDRVVWFAGWPDKLPAVLGGTNPVASSHFVFTIPEPTGVVAVIAPEASALLGLVSRLAAVLAGGNVAILLASESAPLPAVTLAETLAVSDVPAGVVNILTGRRAELVPHLVRHADVDGLDLWGCPEALLIEAEQGAAEHVARVARRPYGAEDRDDSFDGERGERIDGMTAFLEMKSVWHPIGS
jgi:acyl-CoA reductase-like NAD-dependent aldehyde dehydrogenase